MGLDSMDIEQMFVMSMAVEKLHDVLVMMRSIYPGATANLSQWPRVVIDVPSQGLSDFLQPIPTARSSGLSDCNSLDQALPASPCAERLFLGGEGDVAAVRPTETVEKTEADIPIPAPEPSPVEAGMHRGGVGESAAPDAILSKTGRAIAPRWTEADDDMAIQLCRDGFGIEDIAVKLGRPLEGTKFRFKNALRDRVIEARRKVAKPAVVTAAAKVEPVPSALVATPVAASATQAAPKLASPGMSGFTSTQAAIARRLDVLGYKNGHTADSDLALIRRLARGEKLQVIATDWSEDPRALIQRFAGLCGSELPSPDLQTNLLVVLAVRTAQAA